MTCHAEVMAPKTEPMFGACALGRGRVQHDALLVRIVTGRAGQAVPGLDRQDDVMLLFGSFHELRRIATDLPQEMMGEELPGHLPGVTAPAKKAHVRPEIDALR